MSRIFPFVSMICLLAGARLAFAFPFPAPLGDVVEYHNVHTGHYFMTENRTEAASIEAGQAGAGWVRTGYVFGAYAYPFPGGPCVIDCGQPVSRFYAPGPNTHFYTLDAAEAEGLKRPGSGWIFEGFAFYASVPAASGDCGFLTPVYRLYNNRFAFNDSNHRFVTREEERSRMRSKGWIDEGVKLCAHGAAEGTIKSFAFTPALREGKIQPSSVCEDEARNLGSCMALNNLAAPTTQISLGGGFTIPNLPPPIYGSVTGLSAYAIYIAGPLPDAVAATTVFVQQADFQTFGVHVDTIQRGPAIFTSVNPLFQFKTTVDAGAADTRLFPFARGVYETDGQISVKFQAHVRTLNVRNSASHAYGHPTIEFIDQRSGRHVYFTVLVYGTVAAGDFVAPDVVTRKVIVGTTFREDSPFVRNVGMGTFATPSGFVAENVWGRGGAFEFRMDRTEFQRVLDAARRVDAALSPDPADYLVDNFHFNNEVVGDGEIGMNLAGFRLEIVRR